MGDPGSVALLVKKAAAPFCSACAISGAELQTIPQYPRLPPGLSYLQRQHATRLNIKNWYPQARSVLICAFQYWHDGAPNDKLIMPQDSLRAHRQWRGQKRHTRPSDACLAGGSVRLARYALFRDYHITVKEQLAKILDAIRLSIPEADGKPFADSSPVCEKRIAAKAGLGIIGRNTLLINREIGSFAVLGGLALNIEAQAGAPDDIYNPCAGCGKCEAACPTNALQGGRLDPEKCMAYWTTQDKETPPEWISGFLKDHAEGCDICQEICPANAAAKRKDPGIFPVR